MAQQGKHSNEESEHSTTGSSLARPLDQRVMAESQRDLRLRSPAGFPTMAAKPRASSCSDQPSFRTT